MRRHVRVRMACGEDVHTRPSVVDSRYVAVEKPGGGAKESRTDRAICQQISQFAKSPRRPSSRFRPGHPLSYVLSCRAEYEERNAHGRRPDTSSRQRLARSWGRIPIEAPPNAEPVRRLAGGRRPGGGVGARSRGAHRERPRRSDLRRRDGSIRPCWGRRRSPAVTRQLIKYD
jgi:hypothetical protein